MLIRSKARSTSAGFSLQVLQRHCADIVAVQASEARASRGLVSMRAIALRQASPTVSGACLRGYVAVSGQGYGT